MPKPKLVQEDLPLPTPAGVPALDAVAPTEKQAVTAADVAAIIARADESVKEQVRIAPPSRISERGPEAEIVWRTRWAEGNGNNLNEYDLDQIAAAASE